jgi:hypothetical protein
MTAIQPAGGTIRETRDSARNVDADAGQFAEIADKAVDENSGKPGQIDSGAVARTAMSKDLQGPRQKSTAVGTSPGGASRSPGVKPAVHRNPATGSHIGGSNRDAPDLRDAALHLVRRHSNRLGRIDHDAVAREITSMAPARQQAMIQALFGHVITKPAPRERLRAALRQALVGHSDSATPPSSGTHRRDHRISHHRGHVGEATHKKARMHKAPRTTSAKPGHPVSIPRPRPPDLGPQEADRHSTQPPQTDLGTAPQSAPSAPGSHPNGPVVSPVIAVPSFSLVPAKSGVGWQPTLNAAKPGIVAFDYFAKAGWLLHPEWMVTGKIKYASDQAVRWANGNGTPATAGTVGALQRFASALTTPRKLTIDLGLNWVPHQATGGVSAEFSTVGLPTVRLFVAQTDPATLVDKTKTKIKLPRLLARVAVSGNFGERFQQWVGAKFAATEFELAGEAGAEIGEHARGYFTPTWKASGENMRGRVTPAATASGLATGTGFAGALMFGWAGYQLSDRFVTEGWTYRTPKEGVNQLVGGVTAAYGYAAIQKVVDNQVARLTTSGAGGSLARMAPVINSVRSAWTTAASTAAGRVAGAVFSRVGILGVVMPVIAAAKDIQDAHTNFQAGQKAEGWRSVERGAVRAGAALLGTVGVVAAATALGASLPVLAVIATGVGIGLLGDWVARQI